MSFQFLFLTVPKNKGKELGRKLLEKRLVACVNIVEQVQSLYWWKGKIEEDMECLLIGKTRKEKKQEILEILPQLHPYEVPEILFVDMEDGFPPYLHWLAQEIQDTKEG